MLKTLPVVIVLSLILVGLGCGVLALGHFYGPLILAMALVPLVGGKLTGLTLNSILPDILFGAIDTGLLTFAGLLGAAGFGIAGAIVGAVVGDAVTDAIAGFFEGGIAQWLRKHGIDESRTALGSACGKMAGCLMGSGIVLTFCATLGLLPDSMA